MMNNDILYSLIRHGFTLVGTSYRRDFENGTHAIAMQTGDHAIVFTYTKKPLCLLSGKYVFHVDEVDDFEDFLRKDIDTIDE